MSNTTKRSSEKRYWWLKLPEDFFRSKEIRYLKRKPNGYRLVCIYLGMMLASLKNGGALSFEGMGETPEEEIAITLDEDVRHVITVVEFLKKYGLLIERAQTEYYLPFVEDHTGSEGASAQRKRDQREKEAKADNVTQNTDNVTGEVLQCHAKPLQSNADTVTLLSQCHTDTVTSSRRVRDRVELEKEIEKEVEYSEMSTASQTTAHTPLSLSSSTSHTAPSLSEVIKYCEGKNVDAERFWNYYNAIGWKIKSGVPIDNWRQLVDHWDKTERPKPEPAPEHKPSYGDLSQYEKCDQPWIQDLPRAEDDYMDNYYATRGI